MHDGEEKTRIGYRAEEGALLTLKGWGAGPTYQKNNRKETFRVKVLK
ncbi:hypothetical protein [Lactococcus garvieae]|uniref:Uncharacterized protein n=1 Tax=Lactococcus garvieae DCC43 TaxID=1231377 RepID=K2PPC1_9LACT|nr:hypothetical protein [Lactococcus garvieae]EKF52094.1 hypothetical protein C426_0565 [Lactococcus garvieae DCC43]